MVNCFAPHCSHRGEKCRMYRFPSSPSKFRMWSNLVRRKDKMPQQRTSRLCSCHFPDHNKAFLPIHFPWNVAKRLTFSSPEKSRRHHKAQPANQELVGKVETPASSSLGLPGKMDSSSLELRGKIDEQQLVHSAAEATSDSPICDSINYGDSPENIQHVVNAPKAKTKSLEELGREEKEKDEVSENTKIYTLQEELDREMKERNEESENFENVMETTTCENGIPKDRTGDLKKGTLNITPFSFAQIAHRDKMVSHFTGLPNAPTFRAFVRFFDGIEITYNHGWPVKRISVEDQIFMTLLKLRRNLSNLDLAVRFNVSETTVANIVLTWIHTMHYVFFVAEGSLMSKIPSRFKNQTDLPECFKKFPNTRIVLDCTEVRTAIPSLLSRHNHMFSPYKNFVTGKGLIGIAPNGTVTFASDLYPGRTSDKDIVAHCKVLDQMQPGDAIMADKGFLISSMLPEGVSLNIPPFRETPQFTERQIERTYIIAQARIHVERAIRRVKSFLILNFIPQSYVHVASEIFKVCSTLTNFMKPLIRENAN